MADPMKRLLLLVCALLTLSPALAGAQGLGGFVSPGPLAEDHADLDTILKCTSCHEPGAGVTPARCMACHERVEDQVQTRTGFHANLGDECASCHGDHKGRDFELVQLSEETFNHQSTGFALTGEHKPLECNECHQDAPEDYTGLESSCESCHDEPHGAGASTRELLNNCRTCHDADDWDALPIALSIFDHNDSKQADYPLHDAHDDVECDSCHKETKFVPTVAELCTDCHDDPHRKQFAKQQCTDCHTDRKPDWNVRPWDHDKRTQFALVGVHNDVSCASCHGKGAKAQYAPLPHERCSTCHEDVHEGQFEPRDCDSCHQQVADGFEGMVIDHDETNYPLRNAHQEVTCEDCHGEGPAATFAGLPFADCADCHEDRHDARFAPDACQDCHVTDGLWDVDAFDHARTQFALVGAHVEVQCAECHGEGEEKVLEGLDYATCRDCHSDDNPHDESVAELACTTCHDENAWEPPLPFDHDSTGWPLIAKHAQAECEDCHEGEGPRFDQAETACESCHEDDVPPNHYEGVCADCHKPTDWRDATLGREGHASTGFALLGMHSVLPCDDCHGPAEPSSTAGPECIDCHLDDDPHRGLLGTQCGTCHEEKDWMRTTFRHAQTGFALRGSHRVAGCDDCHAAGYPGTPADCGSCHTFDAPGDALHRDPLTRDCDTCHRPYTWEDANFPHGELE